LNEASIVRIESLKNATLLVEQSLRIDTEIGNRAATIDALTSLSRLHRATADMSGAIKFAEQALASARETANATDEARILIDLGNLLNNTGNPEAGRKRYQEGLARSREIGYRSGIERATTNLAIIAYFTGDLAGARSGFEESLRLKRESGNRDSIAYTLTFLGRVAVSAGDLTAARRYFEESAQIYRSIGETPTGPTVFITPVEIAEGHPERVEAALMPLTAKYNRPAPGGQIWMALAESWLARGNLQKAGEASARASGFAAQSPNRQDFGIPAGILAARLAMEDGHYNKARADLNALLAESRKLHNVLTEFDARLAIAQVEQRSGNVRAAAADLRDLQRDSTRAGFGLIASAADRLAKGSVLAAR